MTLGRLSALLLLSMACDGARLGVGEPCAGPFDCEEGTVCFATAADPVGEGRCMARCDPEQTLCLDRSVCTASATDPELRVCYLGGLVEEGFECTATTDCERGAVCVDPGDGVALCFRSCDRRAPACAAGLICAALTEPAGYCAVPADS